MNVILDTNTLISAIIFNNRVETLINILIEDPRIYLFSSDNTQQELYSKLFSSQKIQNLISKSKRKLNNEQVVKFYEKAVQIFIKKYPREVIEICRDPKDNMWLELANECSADYIITGDKDLLEIADFNGCKILKPSEFLEIYNK